MAVRVTQIPVETSVAPTTGQVRVTQIPVEVSVAPDTGQVRVTQIAVETSILHTEIQFYFTPILPATIHRRRNSAALQAASMLPLGVTKRKKPNVFIVT